MLQVFKLNLITYILSGPSLHFLGGIFEFLDNPVYKVLQNEQLTHCNPETYRLSPRILNYLQNGIHVKIT